MKIKAENQTESNELQIFQVTGRSYPLMSAMMSSSSRFGGILAEGADFWCGCARLLKICRAEKPDNKKYTISRSLAYAQNRQSKHLVVFKDAHKGIGVAILNGLRGCRERGRAAAISGQFNALKSHRGGDFPQP